MNENEKDVAKEPEQYSDPEMQKLKEDRDEAIKAVMERKVFLAEQYVKPHTKVARRVKDEDLQRVLDDAALMHEMCLVGRGEYSNAFAIAHNQINEEDPLRFYVTAEGQIFVNPVITGKGHEIHTVQEGCMSYPEEPFKQVIRYKKITIKYRTVGHKTDPDTGESLGEFFLTKEVTQDVEGQDAQIMQHECQHLNGSDIYQQDASATKAFGESKALDFTT